MSIYDYDFSPAYCDEESGSQIIVFLGLLDANHNLEVRIDGQRWGVNRYYPVTETVELFIPIPNDGRRHDIEVVDPGGRGTQPTSAAPGTDYLSNCDGPLQFRVQQIVTTPYTGEQTVTVSITGEGTGRLRLDGSNVGPLISLNGGSGEVRDIIIPADGKKHVIDAQVRAPLASDYSENPGIWYVIQAHDGPTGPGDPSQIAEDFVPGESVIVASADDAVPLATDGSEWVFVEISPREQNQWQPAGGDLGMVAPNDDGSWSTTIETNPQDFPVGTGWDVRVRRFRNYQASAPEFAYFDMVSGTISPGDLTPPAITAPVNHTQRGNTWCVLEGLGVPGAKVEFSVERVTPWGSLDDPPLTTTVGKTGRWVTFVWGQQRAHPVDYKILGYRARHRVNGHVSDWSNRLDVTWQHPLR